MSDFVYDPAKHIVIENKAYEKETLPDEIKQAIRLVNISDERLAQLTHDLNVYKIGRDNMVSQLIEKLGSVEALAELPAPQEAE